MNKLEPLFKGYFYFQKATTLRTVFPYILYYKTDHNMKYSTLIFFCIFISFEGFSQGKIDGFYKGTGNGAIVIGGGIEDSRSYLAGKKEVELSRELNYLSLFVAYGITDNLDINLSVPYLIIDKQSDFQDASIFIKYRFFQKKFEKESLELNFGTGFSTPISDYAVGGLNDIGQQATIVDMRIMLHYSVDSGLFATLQTGYSIKFGSTPNSVPITLKGGIALKSWYFDGYYDYQHSFNGIDYLGSPGPQDFRELAVDYHKIGGTIYKSFCRNLGVSLNAGYTLGGQNIFKGPNYGAGVVYNLIR